MKLIKTTHNDHTSRKERYTTIKLFWKNFVGNLKPRKGPKTDFQSRMNTFNTNLEKFTTKSVLFKPFEQQNNIT